MTTDDIAEVVRGFLFELSACFIPGMKLTFIARFPGDDESALIITADNLKELSELLVKYDFREKAETPKPTGVLLFAKELAKRKRKKK